MEELLNKVRRMFGSLILFFGLLVLVLGIAVLYAGAWLAGAPFKVGSDDLSTEDLRKYYRDHMDRGGR